MSIAAIYSALRTCAQDHVADLLTDTCTIQRQASVSDGKGGRIVTYSTLESDVACSVAPRGGDERVVGVKPSGLYDTLISFNLGQDVIYTDRIIWEGRTFEVELPRPRTGGILLQVEAREIK